MSEGPDIYPGQGGTDDAGVISNTQSRGYIGKRPFSKWSNRNYRVAFPWRNHLDTSDIKPPDVGHDAHHSGPLVTTIHELYGTIIKRSHIYPCLSIAMSGFMTRLYLPYVIYSKTAVVNGTAPFALTSMEKIAAYRGLGNTVRYYVNHSFRYFMMMYGTLVLKERFEHQAPITSYSLFNNIYCSSKAALAIQPAFYVFDYLRKAAPLEYVGAVAQQRPVRFHTGTEALARNAISLRNLPIYWPHLVGTVVHRGIWLGLYEHLVSEDTDGFGRVGTAALTTFLALICSYPFEFFRERAMARQLGVWQSLLDFGYYHIKQISGRAVLNFMPSFIFLVIYDDIRKGIEGNHLWYTMKGIVQEGDYEAIDAWLLENRPNVTPDTIKVWIEEGRIDDELVSIRQLSLENRIREGLA